MGKAVGSEAPIAIGCDLRGPAKVSRAPHSIQLDARMSDPLVLLTAGRREKKAPSRCIEHQNMTNVFEFALYTGAVAQRIHQHCAQLHDIELPLINLPLQ